MMTTIEKTKNKIDTKENKSQIKRKTFFFIWDTFILISMLFSILVLFYSYQIINNEIVYSNSFAVFLNKYDYIFEIIFIFDLIVKLIFHSYNEMLGKDINTKNIFLSTIRYSLSTKGIVDILVLIPFFIVAPIWKVIRILKIYTLSHLFIYAEESIYFGSVIRAFVFLGSALKSQWKTFLTVTSVFVLIIIVFSLIVYNIELTNPGTFLISYGEEVFDFGDAFWFTFVSITTIGYGDIYPITELGRFIVFIISMFGMMFIALYTAIVVNGFTQEFKKTRKFKENKENNEDCKNNKNNKDYKNEKE